MGRGESFGGSDQAVTKGISVDDIGEKKHDAGQEEVVKVGRGRGRVVWGR